jgi:hypothetical protein
MSRTLLFTSLVALGLASAVAAAAPKSVVSAEKKQTISDARGEGRSPIIGASGKTLRASVNTASSTSAPTADQVGDADTFGHAVIWDGLLSTGTISFASDCTPQPGDPPPGPNDRCVQLNPAPAMTTFDLPNIGQMYLPAKTSHNILCHWTSANGVYSMLNSTGVNANARFTLHPYLVVESSVLSDPLLIDPTTGLPFNGSLTTAPGTTFSDGETLAPGARKTERMSDSRVCIAGAISRQGLIQGYGLTNTQVDNFFKNPITLKFGLSGSATLVDFASLIYGVRIMGD